MAIKETPTNKYSSRQEWKCWKLIKGAEGWKAHQDQQKTLHLLEQSWIRPLEIRLTQTADKVLPHAVNNLY